MEGPTSTWCQQGEGVSSPGPEALEKTLMACHGWELYDGGRGEGKGPWAALLPTHLFSRQESTGSVMMCWVLHSGS